jgi:hypothetical protein
LSSQVQTESIYLVFGRKEIDPIQGQSLFLITWSNELDCWQQLGQHKSHWLFAPWAIDDAISSSYHVYKLPNDLWEGLRYYSDQLGEKRSYRIFFKSLLTFLPVWIKTVVTRKPMSSLINAEFIARVIRASGHVVLPGTKAGSVTPELLEEAVREIDGISVSMTKDTL